VMFDVVRVGNVLLFVSLMWSFLVLFLVFWFFFFFQAEDGIRDFHVTGVQTCALPIWILKTKPASCASGGITVRSRAVRDSGPGACAVKAASSSSTPKLLMAEPKNTGVCRPAR